MKGNNMEEKVIKEMLKRIIDSNNDIPIKAKADLKSKRLVSGWI